MCKASGIGLFMLVLLAGMNLAQGEEVSAPAAPKIYSKNVSFRLPVQIDDRQRAELQELKLFVRTPSTAWVCRETAPATQKVFCFHAPGDGEYCFLFVMVDKNGKSFPESVDQTQPGLVVIVDTQVPEVEVRSVNGPNGQVYLYGTILDANPDYMSMKMDYFEGGQWKPLSMLSDCPGAFMNTDPRGPAGKIRVYAADRAGNSVTREVELHSTPAAAAPSVPPVVPPMSAPILPAQASAPTPPATALVPALAPPAVAMPPAPTNSPLLPTTTLPPLTPPLVPPPGIIEPREIPEPLNTHEIRAASNATPTSVSPREGILPKTAFVVKEVPPPSNVPVVNSLRCRLDFSLDAKAEGSPVEVWATADGSKSWVKCGEIPQGRSPAVVALPQDGTYGFLFTAQTPGGTLSPRPGTMPDAWVEVDTTKPTLELQSIKMGSGAEAGDLLITWHAHDRNFGTEPVHIYYTTQTAGQWFAIAQGLPNSGKYRWTVPSGLTRVFIRIEVTDRAGNMTRAETPEAIQVECARIPVKVLNIAPVPGSEK